MAIGLWNSVYNELVRRVFSMLLYLLIVPGPFPVFADTIESNKENLSACGAAGQISLPNGAIVRVRLALSEEDKAQGLSGLDESDFAKDEALLMMNTETKTRLVNMGDTYFDLDVFFLNDELVVVGVQRELKAHPGRAEPPAVPKSMRVEARHVLEMRADSRLAAAIELGMPLTWVSQPSTKEIEECVEQHAH